MARSGKGQLEGKGSEGKGFGKGSEGKSFGKGSEGKSFGKGKAFPGKSFGKGKGCEGKSFGKGKVGKGKSEGKVKGEQSKGTNVGKGGKGPACSSKGGVGKGGNLSMPPPAAPPHRLFEKTTVPTSPMATPSPAAPSTASSTPDKPDNVCKRLRMEQHGTPETGPKRLRSGENLAAAPGSPNSQTSSQQDGGILHGLATLAAATGASTKDTYT